LEQTGGSSEFFAASERKGHMRMYVGVGRESKNRVAFRIEPKPGIDPFLRKNWRFSKILMLCFSVAI
jgi:hypothetical protein